MAPRVTHWIGTDVGLIRDRNEDAFLWLGPDDTEDNGWLWVVADGMGGESAGDVASALVVSHLRDQYGEVVDATKNPYAALERCLQEANQRVVQVGEIYPDLRGLGSTAVALAVRDGKAYVAHVGDSRCYWLHRGELRQLTRYHTRAESVLALGHATRAEAEKDPGASVLTRAIGRPKLEVDFGAMQPLPIDDDDVFFLCSDGVWSVLDENVIREAMSRLHARDAVEVLVELARRQWSDDNLTAAVVRFAPPIAARTMSRESFLDWAGAGLSQSDAAKTMVLQAVRDRSVDEQPPQTNAESIPRITAQSRPTQKEPDPIERTATLSPDDMHTLLRQVDAEKAARDAGGEAASTATLAFSVDAIRAATAAAGAPEAVGGTERFVPPQARARPPLPSTDVPALDSGGTMSFSRDEMDKLAAALRDRPTSVIGAPGAPAPPAGNRSTLFFSADDVHKAEARARIESAGPQRDRTSVMSAADIAALSGAAPGRERTRVMSRDELQAMLEAPPVRRRSSAGVLVGIALTVLLLGGAAAWVLLRPAAEPVVTGDGSASAAATPAAPASPPGPSATELAAALPPVPPPAPRPPDGTHDTDAMPYYRVEYAGADGQRVVLRIDAHEVLVSQMTAVRAAVPDMETVYSISTAPLYEHMPCDGVRAPGADATSSRRPACAAAEAAEAYCAAVGRRMPTPADWNAILASSAGLVAPGRDAVWTTRADGAPPAVATDINGILGVRDGLAEILRGSRATIVRGDLPLLMPAGAGAPPIVERAGLLAQLRARSLPLNELPMLGFRCVVDEAAELADATPRAAVGTPARSSRRSTGTAEPRRESPARTAPERDRAPRPTEREATVPADRTPRPRGSEEERAPVASSAEREATEPAGPRRIELMDPVYLPATIDEFEAQAGP